MLKPIMWQSAMVRLAEQVDEAFTQWALAGPRPSARAKAFTHMQRLTLLSQMADFYEEVAHAHDDFFVRPAPIQPERRSIRTFRRRGQPGEVIGLTWQSAFEPLWPDDVRTKYLAQTRNARGYARWFRHGDKPRPTAVLLHGYMGGNMTIEERLWPIGRWFDLGMDLVLSCLPFHGVRADPARGWAPPRFPSSDPRFTVEGFRQVVFDHQALFSYLLNGCASAVGMMGMSAGGYSTALLATVEPRLAFAVPVIPLASLSGFAHARGRLPGSLSEQQAIGDALQRVHQSIDPLLRSPQVPAERSLVVAGRYDRVTPVEHAERIADHLGAPLVLFEGGHVLQNGRGQALLHVEQMLQRLDLLPS